MSSTIDENSIFIPIEQLYISELNSRKTLDSEKYKTSIQELANDIKQNGLIDALTVRKNEEGKYEVIAGQRRFLALKEIGSELARCHVINVNNQKAEEISLVENVQRNQMTKKDKIETNFISSCPSEIILKIISYLPKRYAESLKCTSKFFNDCLQKNGMILTDLQKENVNKLMHMFETSIGKYINLNIGTGTGKTITTLTFLNELAKNGKKSLIITKKILSSVWKDEEEKNNKNSLYVTNPIHILNNPITRSNVTLEMKKEKIQEELENNKIVLLSKTNVWYSEEKKELLNFVLNFGWDLVVYDDVRPDYVLRKLFEFNPNIKCLVLEAIQTKQKNVIGNYQIDVELGTLPKIKTDFFLHKIENGDSTYISNLIIKIIEENINNKTLIVVYGETFSGYMTELGHSLTEISKLKLKNVYILNQNKNKIVSDFSKLKKGILIGNLISLAKGHNIYPQKIFLIEYNQRFDKKLTNNIKYQLIGRIRRPRSPYKECSFVENTIATNNSHKNHEENLAYNKAFLKFLCKKKRTKKIIELSKFKPEHDLNLLISFSESIFRQFLIEINNLPLNEKTEIFFSYFILLDNEKEKQIELLNKNKTKNKFGIFLENMKQKNENFYNTLSEKSVNILKKIHRIIFLVQDTSLDKEKLIEKIVHQCIIKGILDNPSTNLEIYDMIMETKKKERKERKEKNWKKKVPAEKILHNVLGIYYSIIDNSKEIKF